MPEGTLSTVIGGPYRCLENTIWWQLRTSDSYIGWSVEEYAGQIGIAPYTGSANTASKAQPSDNTQHSVSAVSTNSQWTPQSQSFDSVEMVLAPPGCFMMGSNNGNPDEQPVSKICFDKPFWIDKNDVTNQQFIQLSGKAVQNSGSTGSADPRTSIAWSEARDFCTQRNGQLPTEAQWEYATRGPDSLVYPWGNSFNSQNAVYSGNSAGGAVAVGSRPGGASWIGALDMSGNVWNWTSSIYKPYPYKSSDGRENDNDQSQLRVRRGGTFEDNTNILRAAYRTLPAKPSLRDRYTGFRCVRQY
jgi:iron(II)-dependent oxidoreductase